MSKLRSIFRCLFSLIPDKVAYHFDLEVQEKRIRCQKGRLKSVGENFQLAQDVFIMCPDKVSFGRDCAVNEFVHILGGGGVLCGAGVRIANHASIVTATHPTNVEFIGDVPQIDKPIVIEDFVWIGSHAVILPGVTLGRSCIVGAGAIVDKDIPPYSIVVGFPARIIGRKDISQT